MNKLATKVKQLNGSTGFGAVYLVTPPMEWKEGWEDDSLKHEAPYVWVHAANIPSSGPETYIFPCDEEGKVLDWMEMEGSLRGQMNLEAALERAGYRVA